ncbi:MAG: T9SS type A sorting domain-containing protein [Prevotellaceae bacterium]|nr:T9SS type A sorting domain-containing protein [Prevotellaceae bacterium]
MLLGSISTYSQNVTVEATEGTLTGSYTRLRLALLSVASGKHQGEITVKINASTVETTAVEIWASGAYCNVAGYTGTSNYTSIVIYPTQPGLTVSYSPASGGGNLFSFSGVHNLTLDGRVNQTGGNNLTLISAITDNSRVIQFSGNAHDNVVKYCNISGSCVNTSSKDYGAVVFAGGNNNTLENCAVSGGAANAVSVNSGTNAIIRSCDISGFTFSGIHSYTTEPGSISASISNNFIHNTSENVSGIYLRGGIFSIYNNIVLLTQNSTTTYGIRMLATVSTANIYHNTVLISGNGNNSGAVRIENASTLTVKNNIFRNDASGSYARSVFYSNIANVTTDYNNYKGSYYLAPNNYYSLSAWQSAISRDSHSITDDPQFDNSSFVTPDDFQVEARMDAPSVGITTDFGGNTRHFNTMGAWETEEPEEINFWTGASSSNWSESSNWYTGQIPGDGDDVIFSGSAVNDLVLDQDRVIGNLTNLSGKKLEIPAGRSLTVNGSINTGGQSNRILLKTSTTGANASFIFPNETYPVYATVEMYSKAYIVEENEKPGYQTSEVRWQYFGIPFAALTGNALSGAYVRYFDETATSSGKQWKSLSGNAALYPFQGYEISQPSAKTYTFAGQLENDNFTEFLARTDAADEGNKGYHLLANPYTAAIDITKINFGTGMEETVYLFNTGNRNDWLTNGGANYDNLPGQYLAIPKNLAGYTGQASIPSMQGFFVKVISGSLSTFSINYAAATGKNQHALRAPSHKNSDEKIYTTVTVESENYADRMWLFTEAECSDGFDNGWDGYKMTPAGSGCSLFAMQDDGYFQVNATNDVDGTELGFTAGSDTDYTLRFEHNNLQDAYQELYLLDNETGTLTGITENNSQYSFTASNTSSVDNRFTILTHNPITGSDALSAENNVKLHYKDKILLVYNTGEDGGSLTLHDISGRLILERRFEANSISSIPLWDLQQGVYVVKTTCESQEGSNKKIVLK